MSLKSSVSQSIATLESRLGAQLIDRGKRPFELTPAGVVYHEGCRTLLDEYRKLEDRVRKMVDKVVGKVRIAAIYSVGLSEMDRYVAQFRDQFPDVGIADRLLASRRGVPPSLGRRSGLGVVSSQRKVASSRLKNGNSNRWCSWCHRSQVGR